MRGLRTGGFEVEIFLDADCAAKYSHERTEVRSQESEFGLTDWGILGIKRIAFSGQRTADRY